MTQTQKFLKGIENMILSAQLTNGSGCYCFGCDAKRSAKQRRPQGLLASRIPRPPTSGHMLG